MYPMMSEREVKMMETLFRVFEPKKVLEWGAGGSTVHLSTKFPVETWTSVENNLEWAEKVRQAVDRKKIHVWYFDNLDEYVRYGALLEKDPDLVLVDGRERSRCLEEVYRTVRSSVPVILHDCGRTRYMKGAELFPFRKVIVPGESSSMPNSVDKEASDDGLYHHRGLMLMMKDGSRWDEILRRLDAA